MSPDNPIFVCYPAFRASNEGFQVVTTGEGGFSDLPEASVGASA
jgi:hypothetical protein